jgi:AcrR family transcriptional regulator
MTGPIQQQLVTARKDQILEAAAVVFAQKGFHTTTTKDIARQAGVSEGTIYNYFDSKSGLLLGIFDRMKATIIQENMPPAPDELDLRTFIHTFLQQPLMAMKEENFALFRIVISEIMVNEELRTLYYQQILEPTLTLAEAYFEKQATKQGLSPTEASLIIRAISGMVLGVILQHIMGDPTLVAQWEKLPDVLTDLIVDGLENVHS